MEEIARFIAGCVALICAFLVWKNAELVKTKVPWPIAWGGYMLLILIGFEQLARAGIFGPVSPT